MSPFDYVNAINFKKNILEEDPQAEKEYKKHSYIINKAFSYFPDTVMPANAMNERWDCPAKWQFHFFLNTITKGKRRSDWVKKEPTTEALKLVKEYFGYSSEKAKEALTILSQEDLKTIEEKLYKGGK